MINIPKNINDKGYSQVYQLIEDNIRLETLQQFIEITPEAVQQVTAFIKKKYGYDFSNYAFSSFARRLNRVLAKYKIKDIAGILERLENKVFFDLLLTELTVNTTEFFRDPQFWKLFREKAIPELKTKASIRIWHAGCSTGQEVFSMAILLKEVGLDHRYEITATDINDKVLDIGRDGIYPLRHQKQYQENYELMGGEAHLSDYYTVEGSKMIFDPTLLNKVNFMTHDLTLEQPLGHTFDLILSRNVLIYFNHYLQEKVLQMYLRHLKKGGILALGAHESIATSSLSPKFQQLFRTQPVYKLK